MPSKIDCAKKVFESMAGIDFQKNLQKAEERIRKKLEGAPENLKASLGRSMTDDFIQREYKRMLKEEKSKLIENPIEKGWQEVLTKSIEAKKWFGDEARNIMNRAYSSQKALMFSFETKLHKNLKDSGVLDYWNNLGRQTFDGVETRNVMREAEQLAKKDGTPGITKDTNALKVAQIVQNLRTEVLGMKSRVGVDVEEMAGYFIKQAYSARKLLKGGTGGKMAYEAAKKEWVNHLIDRLDVQKTFKGLEDIVDVTNRADLEKYLGEEFGRIESGIHNNELDTPTLVSLARQAQGKKKGDQMRVLHFKNADATADVLGKWSDMNYTDSVQQELVSSARQIELSRYFGSNPAQMFKKVQSLFEQQRQGERPGWKTRVSDSLISLEKVYKELDGSIYQREAPAMAEWGSALRAWQSMMHMGLSVPASIGDVINSASQLNINGAPFMESLGNVVKDTMETMFSIEGKLWDLDRRGTAEHLWVEQNYPFMSMFNRMILQDSQVGGISKALNIYFGLNGMNRWTRAVKTAFQMKLSNIMGQSAEKAFDQLPLRLRTNFERYGIDSKQWDIVRKNVQTDESKMRFITQESIDNANITQAEKDKLHSNFGSMFVDQSAHAVPEPGVLELALMHQGMSTGTVGGEIARLAFQFKGFPIAMISKGYLAQGGGGRTRQEAWMAGARLFTGLTMAGLMSDALFQTATGQNFYDNFVNNPLATLYRGASRGGGTTYLGDLFLTNFSGYGQSLPEVMQGPALSDIEQIAAFAAKTVRGKSTWSDSVKIAEKQLVPNYLFFKQAMDYAILNDFQEWLEPGYLDKLQRRQEELGRGERFLPLNSGLFSP